MSMTRKEALSLLYNTVAEGKPIIGAGVGTGISAKFAEKCGVDIISVFNSGRYRMAGRSVLAGFLPYGDANAILVDMSSEVLPVVENIPVLAGVCGTDPFRLMPVFLKQLKEIGFSGVQNFPTVGLVDGLFRQNIEKAGMGYNLEIETIRIANELDMLTCACVFSEEDARNMAKAGADILVPYMGMTIALTLEEAAKRVQAMHDAAKEVNTDILVLCHGDPIVEPKDVQYIFDHTTDVVGFFCGSSLECFPTRAAIQEKATNFKSLNL